MSFTVYAQLAPQRKTYSPSVHVCANVRAARAAGHTLIRLRGTTYEAVPMTEALTAKTDYGPVPIRNHTAEEYALISGVFGHIPEAHLRMFASQYRGIVCVDWTGQPWDSSTRPGGSTILAGGANTDRALTRGSLVVSGLRIELTHSCLHELRRPPFGRRGVFTLWHELGHFAFNNGLTPRTVSPPPGRGYGSSIHSGAGEGPAYAYMWYYLQRSRLSRTDREAFDRLLSPATTPTRSGAGAH